MKYGDEDRHFKGNKYLFLGIALPTNPNELTPSTMKELSYAGKVRYHENTHDLNIYTLHGIYFTESDVPHVIYQSEKDYETDNAWAREVDNFFGYKLDPHGNFVRRFARIN